MPPENDDDTVTKEYAARLRREKDEAEAAKRKADEQVAALQKRLEDIERKQLEDDKEATKLAEFEKKRADKIERESAEKIAAFQKRVVRAEAARAAEAAGLLDAKYMKYLDLDGLEIADDGSIAGLDERIAKWKADDAVFFKETTQGDPPKPNGDPRAFDPNPATPAPARPNANPNGVVDWMTVSDAQFREALEKAKQVA